MLPEEFSRELNDLRSKVSDMDADVRVTKHAVANMQQTQGAIGAKIEKMEEKIGDKIDKLAAQISSLEVERSRRDGATNLLNMLLKSPVVAWIVGAAVTGWAIVTGRLHL